MELIIPNEVEFSVSIGVGCCCWPIYSSVLRSGILVCPLWKSAPSLAYSDDSRI